MKFRAQSCNRVEGDDGGYGSRMATAAITDPVMAPRIHAMLSAWFAYVDNDATRDVAVFFREADAPEAPRPKRQHTGVYVTLGRLSHNHFNCVVHRVAQPTNHARQYRPKTLKLLPC